MNLILIISAYTTHMALCNISDRIEENNVLIYDIKGVADRLPVHPIHEVIPIQQVQQVPVQTSVTVQPAVPPQMQAQTVPALRRGLICNSLC